MESWTVYIDDNPKSKRVLLGPGPGCHKVEVVPASEVERLREALRRVDAHIGLEVNGPTEAEIRREVREALNGKESP